MLKRRARLKCEPCWLNAGTLFEEKRARLTRGCHLLLGTSACVSHRVVSGVAYVGINGQFSRSAGETSARFGLPTSKAKERVRPSIIVRSHSHSPFLSFFPFALPLVRAGNVVEILPERLWPAVAAKETSLPACSQDCHN